MYFTTYILHINRSFIILYIDFQFKFFVKIQQLFALKFHDSHWAGLAWLCPEDKTFMKRIFSEITGILGSFYFLCFDILKPNF